MSLFISSVFTYDEDAGNYIQAVEGPSGDNQALEPATRKAINNFVIGCKQDGIWTAIKASCILSGARTLAGALIPLVGTAPTNNGFIGIGTDYVRKTGLVGNGTSKYLNSNRASNAQATANIHIAAYVQTASNQVTTSHVIGNDYIDAPTEWTAIQRVSDGRLFIANRESNGTLGLNIFSSPAGNAVGLIGSTRSSSSGYSIRYSQTNYAVTQTALSAQSANFAVFAQTNGASAENYSNARLAFYSIGEAIDLARLDARVTDLINAFAVTIP